MGVRWVMGARGWWGLKLLGRAMKCLHPFPTGTGGKRIIKWEQCTISSTVLILCGLNGLVGVYATI